MSYNARVKALQTRVRRPIAEIPKPNDPNNPLILSPYTVNSSQGWEVASTQADCIGIPPHLNRKYRVRTNTIVKESPDANLRKDTRGLITYQTQTFGIGSMFRHKTACFGGYGMGGFCEIPNNHFLDTPEVILPNKCLLNCKLNQEIFSISTKNFYRINGNYKIITNNKSSINNVYYSFQKFKIGINRCCAKFYSGLFYIRFNWIIGNSS